MGAWNQGGTKPEKTGHSRRWSLRARENGERLVALSERMFLATNSVAYLAQQPGFRTTTEELALALQVQSDEPMFGDVLRRLERCGIIEFDAGTSVAVRLGADDEATLADIAEAVGDWLLTAECSEDTCADGFDLSPVLSQVRQDVFTGLKTMRILRA